MRRQKKAWPVKKVLAIERYSVSLYFINNGPRRKYDYVVTRGQVLSWYSSLAAHFPSLLARYLWEYRSIVLYCTPSVLITTENCIHWPYITLYITPPNEQHNSDIGVSIDDNPISNHYSFISLYNMPWNTSWNDTRATNQNPKIKECSGKSSSKKQGVTVEENLANSRCWITVPQASRKH